ncbi:hypothetical protein [Rhizobium leguminosarum]|uniref:hypothetical protein n=1 Tax=Rhizobium TaxID=379 RepID=UPI00140FED39|nr:hypothetical protein [Rhizobium leguminosarum]QIO64844.1 hypothetical protein HA462_07220 [Rhizobium leguminosarum bv. trifolii]
MVMTGGFEVKTNKDFLAGYKAGMLEAILMLSRHEVLRVGMTQGADGTCDHHHRRDAHCYDCAADALTIELHTETST